MEHGVYFLPLGSGEPVTASAVMSGLIEIQFSVLGHAPGISEQQVKSPLEPPGWRDHIELQMLRGSLSQPELIGSPPLRSRTWA